MRVDLRKGCTWQAGGSKSQSQTFQRYRTGGGWHCTSPRLNSIMITVVRGLEGLQIKWPVLIIYAQRRFRTEIERDSKLPFFQSHTSTWVRARTMDVAGIRVFMNLAVLRLRTINLEDCISRIRLGRRPPAGPPPITDDPWPGRTQR